MINMAYRGIALLSLIGAFIFGALINSAVLHIEQRAIADLLSDQPLHVLTTIRMDSIPQKRDL